MSQSPNSPNKLGGHRTGGSALEDYHRLMAAGHFKPLTSIILSPMPPKITPNPAPKALAPAPTALPRVAYPPPPQRAPTASLQATYSPTSGIVSLASLIYSQYPPTPIMPLLPPPMFPPIPMSRPVNDSVSYHAPVHQPLIHITNSITHITINTRVHSLLEDKLTSWHPSAIVTLSSSITNLVISLGTKGDLGPHGLSSVNDIHMAVGHDGIMSYMALVVKAPGEVKVLLKGQNTNLEGKDSLEDRLAMEWLRQGFHNNAFYECERVGDSMRGVRR